MKLFICSSEFTTRNDPNFGLVISSPHGHISVLTGSPFSPAKHSITDFVVDEDKRGKGYGLQLLKEAVRRFGNDLGGQASSKASVALMHKLGFRMASNSESTMADALEALHEDSSVYMRYKH